DEELSKLYRTLPYATLRLCILAAEHFSADDLLASANVEHELFYLRAFDFRLICRSRACSPFTKPVQANFDAKTDLIFEALNVTQDVWTAVKIDSVPPGVADYLLLLFKSNKGRISGKVRVQGSSHVAYFSTTTNDTLPVAVPNLWVPQENQYKIPTVIEFAITEKTASDATISIFTQGWVDRRGREPH